MPDVGRRSAIINVVRVYVHRISTIVCDHIVMTGMRLHVYNRSYSMVKSVS